MQTKTEKIQAIAQLKDKQKMKNLTCKNFSTEYAVFKKQLGKRLRKNIISEQMERKLSQDEWSIKQKYFDQKWKDILAYMESSTCLKLHLEDALNSKILNQISFPHFSHLKQLHLQQNAIANIQGLSFIDMPKIQLINLEKNKMANISSINKLALSSLLFIDLSSNNFSQIEKIGRFCTAKTSSTIIQIIPTYKTMHETNYQQTRKVQIINSWAKFEKCPINVLFFYQILEYSGINSPHLYIPQLKPIDVLYQKYISDN